MLRHHFLLALVLLPLISGAPTTPTPTLTCFTDCRSFEDKCHAACGGTPQTSSCVTWLSPNGAVTTCQCANGSYPPLCDGVPPRTSPLPIPPPSTSSAPTTPASTPKTTPPANQPTTAAPAAPGASTTPTTTSLTSTNANTSPAPTETGAATTPTPNATTEAIETPLPDAGSEGDLTPSVAPNASIATPKPKTTPTGGAEKMKVLGLTSVLAVATAVLA